MRYHAVNTAIMQPCYLATSFIRGATGGPEFSQGGPWPPLATPKNRPWICGGTSIKRGHSGVTLYGAR